MQKLLKDYLDEWNRKQKQRRKAVIAIVLAAIMLVSGVIWNLAQNGITMTEEPKCRIEEHQHSEACYGDVLICGQEEGGGHTHTEACYQTESELVCEQEEAPGHTHTETCYLEGELVCEKEESTGHTHGESCYKTVETQICGQEEGEGHTHTQACYEKQLICGKEEHQHSETCYIDTAADVEDASVWNEQYAGAEWKGAWGEDLAKAAGIQIGYKESTDNYFVAEDGSHKGYTRYGQFAGDVYTDWDAAFVNFCMHYAGLEESNLFPKETQTAKWYDTFAAGQNGSYLTAPAGYEPQAGDIVFLHKENEETEIQMGIVSSYNKEKNEIRVIEGNSGNAVKENKYAADDTHITAYLKISEMEAVYKNGETGEEEETAAPVAEKLNYEDEQITVKVTAEEAGIIPEGANLKVVPIVADDKETAEQYKDVEAKLQEKAESEEYEIAGFLAYDISFVDADGNKLEPNGKVKVSMDYKKAIIVEEAVNTVAEAENIDSTKDLDVTVMHLEENADGTVKEVVDMVADKTQTAEVSFTEAMEVKKAEFVTDSFSVFMVTWTNKDQGPKLQIQIVDINGKPIGENKSFSWTGSGITVSELVSHYQAPENYYFLKAVVGASVKDATEIYRLRYSERYKYFQYQKPGGTENIKIDSGNQVWFVYEEDTQRDKPNSDDDPLEDVPHTKYIDYLGDGGRNTDTTLTGDDYYRLYLDVTGIPNVEPEPADIVLILDYSSSMGGWFNEEKTITRWNSVIKSAKLAVNTLISDKTKNRMSIIWFDKSAQIAKEFTGYDEKQELLDEINNKEYDTGTNYQAAFMAAQDVLKITNNKKFVIFVTDGEPWGYCANTGYSYTDDNCYGGNIESGKFWAVNQAKLFENLNGFYTVAVKEGAGFLSSDIVDAVRPGAATVQSFSANDEKGMESAFETIVGSVTKQIGDVTITDTIESYMSFAGEKGEALTNFDTDGDKIIEGNQDSELISELGLKVHIHDKGQSITDAQGYSGDYTWKINLNDGTISVNFGRDYFLVRDKIYTLSFNVKIDESADELPYSHTGSSNTDYPENITSSNQLGLYSNKKATVKYSRVENNNYLESQEEYIHPVVQTKTHREVEKIWNGLEAESVEVKITAKASINGTETDITAEILHSDADKHVLNEGNSWAAEWMNLPKQYHVVEGDKDINHGDITYTIQETKINQQTGKDYQYITTYKTSEDGIKTTITNIFDSTTKPDSVFIKVQKTFEGLPNPTQLSDFVIQLKDLEGNLLYELKLTGTCEENVTRSVSEDGMIYTWEIKNLEEGTDYKVLEAGAEQDGYTLDVTVNGDQVPMNQETKVATQLPKYDIPSGQFKSIPEKNKFQYAFNQQNLIVGRFTQNEGYFVWTLEPLSASGRAALVEAIKKDSNFNGITIKNTEFYSTDYPLATENGIQFRESNIRVDRESSQLIFSNKNQWTHIGYGTYTVTQAVNAEIEVKNTYTEIPLYLDLKKYGSSYEGDFLAGAKFDLYKGEKEEDGKIAWGQDPEKSVEAVAAGDSELPLNSGYYKLVETQAPSGFSLLTTPIYFHVDCIERTIELVTENGDSLAEGKEPDMWKLEGNSNMQEDSNSNTYVLSIKNTSVYSLPSAGGIGIYWYIIGGILLMAGAMLIIYKNKCKEILKS